MPNVAPLFVNVEDMGAYAWTSGPLDGAVDGRAPRVALPNATPPFVNVDDTGA